MQHPCDKRDACECHGLTVLPASVIPAAGNIARYRVSAWQGLMNTDNRRADIATFRTATDDRIVKAWISHDRERRAYRLTVVPVDVKTYSDGVVIHTVAAYSGFSGHVADAPRYSRKTLDALAASADIVGRVGELASSLGGLV